MLTDDTKATKKRTSKSKDTAKQETRVVEMPVSQEPEEKIVDIHIDLPTKQKFRVNGDPNKIIELNISDTGIIERLEKGWQELLDEVDKVGRLDTQDEHFTEKLFSIDIAMRKHIDYIFDSNVSEVLCGDSGKMIDPSNGQTRYEHILDSLIKLYADNIGSEYNKIKARTKKYTNKYTKR